MTSVKRTQRKYVQKAYRVRNWREYETGLRARGSLTVWLGLTERVGAWLGVTGQVPCGSRIPNSVAKSRPGTPLRGA